MTTYDASHDYRSSIPARLATASVKEDSDSDLNEIISLEEEIFGEEVIDSERRGQRRSFLGFLLLNVLIWPVIVYVGLQISAAHSPAVTKSLMKSSGVQAMSADQLVATVKGQGRPVFWLGRLSGDKYSQNTTVSGVDLISYLPDNANPMYLNQLDLVIKTYKDLNVYNTQLHQLFAGSGTVVENAGRVTVTFRPTSPDHSVVTFKDRPEVVAIDYPGFQNISTLVNDAQNLAPIS